MAGHPTEHMRNLQCHIEVVIANTFLSVLTPEDKQRMSQGAPRSRSADARMQSSCGRAIVGATNMAHPEEQTSTTGLVKFQQAVNCKHSRAFKCDRVLEEITTAMIRNIPYQYNIEELLVEFKELGLEASYNFVYLPPGSKNRPNLGYAFVNLRSAEMYSHFVQVLTNYRFKKNPKKKCKPASVRRAAVQGLQANMMFARRTSSPSAFFVQLA